ncbi:MAG: HAMP domain-containing histidine kinase [Acidimicrobiales bacterium]|nr:HAMP domain-containing histidine kinase [Acidimicrobiales bacterium]
MGVAVGMRKAAGVNGYVGPDRRYISAEKALRSEWFFATVALAIVALLSITPLANGIQPIEGLTTASTAFVSVAFAITLLSGCLSWFRSFVLRISDELESGFLYLLVATGWLGPVYVGQVYDLARPANEGLFILGSAASVAMTAMILLFRKRLLGAVQNWPARSALALSPLLFVTVGGTIAGWDPSRSSVVSTVLGVLAVLGLGLTYIGWTRNRPSLGFFGLQLTGLAAAEAIRQWFTADRDLALACAALLVCGSAIVGFYGVVVSIRGDLSGRDKRLFSSYVENQKLAVQIAAAHQNSAEQMHSLRSGLLGVEALARSMDDPKGVAGILAAEAERLRGLTTEKRYELSHFDIMDDLNKLAEVHLRASSPCTVEGPNSLMVKAARSETIDAVQSLLANAVRHAPGSPVKVRVGITGDPFAAVAITVEDRGPGIPPKTALKIFDRGFTTHRDGTGIGLAAAKQVVESQGGNLVFQNRIGGGARFTMLIPLDPLGYEMPTAPPQRETDDLPTGGRMFAGAAE